MLGWQILYRHFDARAAYLYLRWMIKNMSSVGSTDNIISNYIIYNEELTIDQDESLTGI